MNVLLFAPPLLLLLLKAMDVFGVISAGAGAAIVQILLGLPFILSHPVEYISKAFNLGRVFIHFCWSNPSYHPVVVLCTPSYRSIRYCVFIFCWSRGRHEGGLFSFLHSKLAQIKLKFSRPRDSTGKNLNPRVLKTEHIATTMFVGNFIGVVCARSLHYQFYSWYFYTLPYLLWQTPFPTWLRLILFVTVESCWNIFPSNVYSSMLLLVAHLIILGGLLMEPPEYPYADTALDRPENTKKAS